MEVRGARLAAPGVELELPPCLLLLRAACSCHLLPESHRRHQVRPQGVGNGRACCCAPLHFAGDDNGSCGAIGNWRK